ncbi:MAG: ATP-binding cassette domain-containing protein, partial [Planctomycetota bacterium]|nr:ATP-binding cassette domain-containing protein [Planctomycetota bacterium]
MGPFGGKPGQGGGFTLSMIATADPGSRRSDILIQMHGVSKEFSAGPEAVKAVQHASLTLKAGEFVLLQGPSGSGKTTLLSIMGCLMKPSRGRS